MNNQDENIPVDYEKIMLLYGTEIKALVYTYVKNSALAEDIAQETFIKCFTNYHQFRGDSLKGWLFKIAINKSKDYLRSSYYKKVILGTILPVNKKYNSAEDQYLVKSEADQITDIVLNLGVKYREVIVLYYYKDLTIKEIAQTLNRNENTVKSHLRKAKNMIRNEVYKYEK
ncbi:sigma-70 family RNA polymerase sigma factor [Aquibacillus kalidii]|uniref:sigma-70 family RNA polymerase sigma factor n=1 Tax=Aquibacillus kalidii TaxID=2762597 RepID=UPI0016475B0C|nr:sigma-70 family RNA polymerase sigma factor [Aquibacillus kalidii]